MRWLVLAFALAGCVINPPAEPSPVPPPQTCPEPAPIVVTAPKPVWPDTCVADWYAKASLPLCVESYLTALKAQQKTIAKKHGLRR